MNQPDILQFEADEQSLHVRGPLTLPQLDAARKGFEDHRKAKILDLSGLTALDTAGALLLRGWEAHGAKLGGFQPGHEDLYRLVSNADIGVAPEKVTVSLIRRLVERVGRASREVVGATVEIVAFLGQFFVELIGVIFHPRRLRLGSIVHHIEAAGINAVPIVGLIAFLISIVLAYQGVEQLRRFGGESFTVNLVAISVLREMGVLLTAIMVAGRSGSAFTAEIGVMKVREEVDALQVLGVNPFEMLVMPRLIALIITLPLLAFVADICGLLGGMAISYSLIGIDPGQYIDRVHTAVANRSDLLAGLIKAPVFALLIGAVGCLHGMKVSGSAESVGRETTASVVKSIFLVLMADAMFSILFQKIGI